MKTIPSDANPAAVRLADLLAAEDGQPIGVMSRDPLAEKLLTEDGLPVGVASTADRPAATVRPQRVSTVE